MKPIIFLITLFSLISLIYSACDAAGQTNVAPPGGTEACGIAIEGCTTYDSTSTAAAPKCGTCASGKAASSDKTACVDEIDDCTTYAADGTCTACKTDYLLTTEKDGCLYGCKTEGTSTNAGTCAACKEGFLLFSDKSCVYGCKTEGTGETLLKCTACNDGYLLTTAKDGCLLGCKTEGTGANAGKCTACNDGYTLSSGTCTKKATQNDNPKNDDDSSFGLHSSLLLLLFTFLL